MKILCCAMLWTILCLPAPSLLWADPPDVSLDRVIRAITHGDYNDALSQLTALPSGSLTPQDRKRARYLTAHCALKLKRYPEALLAFGQVVEQYPELGDYALWNIARIYQELNVERSYAETLRLLMARFPESRLIPQARMALARQLIGVSGEFRAGVEVLQELLAQPGTASYAPEAYLLLGQAYEGLGRRDQALAAYRTLYVRFPTSPEAAGATVSLAALLPPDQLLSTWLTPRQQLERADQLAEAGDCELAIAQVQQIPSAALVDDLQAWATRRQGVCAYRLRHYRQAITALEKFRQDLNTDDRAPEAWYILGLAYQRDGRMGEAERTFRQLATRTPPSVWNAKALAALGLAYEDRQDVPQAVAAYRELVTRFPTADRADELAWRIGWLHYSQGSFSAARQDFAWAAARFPHSMFTSNALYWEAKSLQKSGDPRQARTLYEQVAHEYPYTYYGIRAQEVLRTESPIKGASAPRSLVPPDTTTSDGVVQRIREAPVLSPPAAFHRIRADELLALRFIEDAREEVSQLAKRLGDGLSEQIFIARLYLQAGMALQAIRRLNASLSAVTPRQRLSLPLDFWTMLFPQLYWPEIQEAASQTQLDPLFLLGIIRQESAFNARAVSRADARGLMQLLPSTGRRVFQWLGMDAFRNDLLFDPAVNVRLGAHYLGRLVEVHRGNLILTLTAYNAGPARAMRWLQEMSTDDWDEFIERLPFEETRGYVKNVMRNYGVYQRLYAQAADGQAARTP